MNKASYPACFPMPYCLEYSTNYRILGQLRSAGHNISEQTLARVSTLMHAHVIPNGTYRFIDETEQRKPGLATAS